jgi:hypothetical protein
VPVDISHLPPEEKRERKSVPMMGKTMAIPASGKTAAMSADHQVRLAQV